MLSFFADLLCSIILRDALRAGKRLLKEKNGAASMVRFEKALMLSKALSDRVGYKHFTQLFYKNFSL